MAATDPKDTRPSTNVFVSALLVWCVAVFGGVLVSGPPSATYGALTAGAILAFIAMADGAVSIVLVIARFRDWRPWAALALSAVTVAAAMLRTARHSGP